MHGHVRQAEPPCGIRDRATIRAFDRNLCASDRQPGVAGNDEALNNSRSDSWRADHTAVYLPDDRLFSQTQVMFNLAHNQRIRCVRDQARTLRPVRTPE